MRKWECIVCGLIYDETLGWPDDGIEPGTSWADVPEEWLCPDCAVGKEDFELIATSTAGIDAVLEECTKGAPIVIIGTGLAGYGLAKEIRKLDADSPLVLVTADGGEAYSKPMLSTGFTKGTTANELVQSEAKTMTKTLNAAVMTRTRVTAINIENQSITLTGNNKKELAYSKLVLALGADVITPPMDGDGCDRIFSINNLSDYRAFRQTLDESEAQDICIIGAGLIGCEYCNDMLNGGYRLHVVDALSTCLPALVPAPAGDAIRGALEARGVQFHFGTTVNAVHRDGEGLRIVLASGDTLQADLVVSAIGVRPSVKLAQNAGLRTDRGICTDRLLRTSAHNIYAIGDCAEVDGLVLVYVAPLMAQARALSKTLTGIDTPVNYPAMPVTVKLPACPTVISPPAKTAEGEWAITQDGTNVKAEFRNADGDLCGFAVTGSFNDEKRRLQSELPAILK